MRGYCLAGSKSGGLTIQPWMSSPSGDRYQISSTSPRRTSASSPALVRCRVRMVAGSSTSEGDEVAGHVVARHDAHRDAVVADRRYREHVVAARHLPDLAVDRREVEVARPPELRVHVDAGAVGGPAHDAGAPPHLGGDDPGPRAVGGHHVEALLAVGVGGVVHAGVGDGAAVGRGDGAAVGTVAARQGGDLARLQVHPVDLGLPPRVLGVRLTEAREHDGAAVRGEPRVVVVEVAARDLAAASPRRR